MPGRALRFAQSGPRADYTSAPLMAEGSLALVTGCPGWLGNRLLHYLRRPHPDLPEDVQQPRYERVRCLVLPHAPVERLRELVPDVELVEGDIRDPAAVGR